MAPFTAGILAFLAGCAPRPVGALEVCYSEAPGEGLVIVHPVVCGDEVPPLGEGRDGADVLLANSRFRAVIRSPEHAVTVLGTGGGTLLDAAPWSGDDPLHEGIPLVGGGWLDVDEFELLADGVRVAGTVVDLPDRPADTPGARREITWRILPDDPWLHLEGADGLWLHPAGGVLPYVRSTRWQDDAVLLAVDGRLDADLGGAVRLADVSRVLVADTVSAWAELDPAGTPLSGEAPGAAALELLTGDAVVGRVGLDPSAPTFDLVIPGDVDAVRSVGPGALPSDPQPPGPDRVLPTRMAARIHVAGLWEGLAPREVGLAWTSPVGSGSSILGLEGTDLVVEPGEWTVTASLGPSGAPSSAAVDARAGQTVDVALPLRQAWDPGNRVLAAFGLQSDGAWSWRGTDAEAVAGAAADGLGYAVFAPVDEIGAVDGDDDLLRVVTADGNLATSDAGWTILSWPWEPNEKFAAHGAPDLRALDPATAVSVATGPTTRRFTAVDLPWLEAAPQPWDVRFPPDFVRLETPAGDLGRWQAWWSWLDAGRAVTPLGPATWVEGVEPAEFGATEVENGLILGAVSAGTGPLVALTWDGVSPGRSFAPRWPRLHKVDVEIRGHGSIDRVALVATGGIELDERTVAGDGVISFGQAPDPGSWVVAAAWSTAGPDWAVTGPLWVDPPGG